MSNRDTGRIVSWTAMEHGTADDYAFLDSQHYAHVRTGLVDNLLNILQCLRGPTLGYPIDRYDHSLQSATRALRNGESTDLVAAALLHDIGDAFAPENHSAAGAAVLQPYVDERTHWVIAHHGLFQGYYYFHHLGGDRDAREQYRDSPHYDACLDFCENYDQNCFDPKYPNLAADDFRPLLDEVFSRPSQVPATAPLT
ncbi:HD domain-containing protein [Candidatus Poriferisodalis sp.]|uniref:HD domain-containing protein n=1 Tax=Candidatus Poriferisodalis sp. TaxID=3101277 RepID=UPI003B02623C